MLRHTGELDTRYQYVVSAGPFMKRFVIYTLGMPVGEVTGCASCPKAGRHCSYSVRHGDMHI